MEEIKLNLKGLDCAGCAAKIEDKVGKLEVVKDVPRQEIKVSAAQKKKHRKVTLTIAALFIKASPVT